MFGLFFGVIISNVVERKWLVGKRKGFFMKAIERLKDLLYRYRHGWVALYALIYMPWFTYLEQHNTYGYYVIQSPIDNLIPFCEYFVVPYLLWFVYILATYLYFFFTDKKGFYRLCALMFTGMTLFLIICTVFPNGLHLRPYYFTRDNIFIDLVKMIYAKDTSTNVLPSLHVFNSLCCAIALCKSDAMKKHKGIQIGACVLTVLIILSTMFLKQHSVTDVFAAFVMTIFIYPFVYEGAAEKRKKTQAVFHRT